MDGESRFKWTLQLEPRRGFLLSVPTTGGPMDIFFPMPDAEAVGLILALAGTVPTARVLFTDQVIEWLQRRGEAERESDEQFLVAAGIKGETL